MSTLRTVGELETQISKLTPAQILEIASACCGGSFESPLYGDIFETYIQRTELPRVRGVSTDVRVYCDLPPSGLASAITWAAANHGTILQLSCTWKLNSGIRIVLNFSDSKEWQYQSHYLVAFEDTSSAAADRAAALNAIAQQMQLPYLAEVADGAVVVKGIHAEKLELIETYPPRDPYSVHVGGSELIEDAFLRVIQSIPASDVSSCTLMIWLDERSYDQCHVELSSLSQRWQLFLGSLPCDATKKVASGDYSTIEPPFVFPLFQWNGSFLDEFRVVEGILDVKASGDASLRLYSSNLTDDLLSSWSRDLRPAISEATQNP